MKPVSKTAYYCCGVRMKDAEKRRPVCGDQYAKRFMDADMVALFAPIVAERRPALSNAARARLIDDHLRKALAQDPKLSIITVGAGFDTRPYRIRGGRWLEFDEPALVTLKNERLPIAECQNQLTRVSIDFESERLADKLAPFASQAATVFVFEGVFMYLEQLTIADTLRTLPPLFPRHTLICDLLVRSLLEKRPAKVQQRLAKMGAIFKLVEDPYAVFEQNGYRLLESESTVAVALELSLPGWLSFLSRALPRDIRDGSRIAVFASPSGPRQ